MISMKTDTKRQEWGQRLPRKSRFIQTDPDTTILPQDVPKCNLFFDKIRPPDNFFLVLHGYGPAERPPATSTKAQYSVVK
jgi:hypothetical protein